MNAALDYIKLEDAAVKSAACAAITQTIPEWFGIDSANRMYAAEIADKEVFAAMAGDRADGLIALKYHFDRTAEVWWMGVRADQHRRGIGRQLMDMAMRRARQRQCLYAVLQTLSPASADKGYAATRQFYVAQGFEPLVHLNEENSRNPMMWMIKRL